MREAAFREDEVQFASLVTEAEAGESVTVTRQGRPVAQIVPFVRPYDDREHAKAAARLLESMKAGLDLGERWKGRDELYRDV